MNGRDQVKVECWKNTVLTIVRVDSLANISAEVFKDGIKLREQIERCEKLPGVHVQLNLKWQKTLEELRKN